MIPVAIIQIFGAADIEVSGAEAEDVDAGGGVERIHGKSRVYRIF
jgi:hypothetical protein